MFGNTSAVIVCAADSKSRQTTLHTNKWWLKQMKQMKWKQWAVEMSFLNHFQRWKITFVKNNLVRADKAEELLQKPE